MDNAVLREVIRLSLRDFTLASSTGHRDSPPQGDSPRQKLVDGILFSRKFILTYHVVIASVVLILSLSNWTTNLLRWIRRRNAWRQLLKANINQEEPIHPWNSESVLGSENNTSSGSSTLEGTSSPPRKVIDEDEETPLLNRKPRVEVSRLSLLSALLMYQPPPIPLLNKTLPSIGACIIIVCFLGLNTFYCLYALEFNTGYVFVIADRFGIVFIANLPLLYLLAAKNQPLKILTGRSYESLNVFHRRLGELLCLLAILHGAGMTFVWYTLIRPRGLTFASFLLLPVIIFGVGALLSYESLYFTSLGSFRQRWYEIFLGLHVFLQAAALAFVYFHHPIGQPYVLISLAIFLVDRLIYRAFVKSTTVTANAKLMEDEETVKLTMRVPSPSASYKLSSLIGKSITSGWKPTDHVFVTINALGRDHYLQAHPFTISNAAPTIGNHSGSPTLELLIRSQTGFSRDLLHYVHRHNSLTLRLDGPYGSSHARDFLADSETALVVAGGSGIAVAWPLIEHLIHLSSISTDVESIPFHPPPTRRKVIFVWVIHQATHMSWLSKHDLEMAKSMGVHVIIPAATEEAGRPDLKGIIRGCVSKYGGDGRKVGVVASGPDGMGRVVRNTCAEMVREGKDVGVVIEKFGW